MKKKGYFVLGVTIATLVGVTIVLAKKIDEFNKAVAAIGRGIEEDFENSYCDMTNPISCDFCDEKEMCTHKLVRNQNIDSCEDVASEGVAND